jgi:DASH complex subunit DAD1
VEALWSQFENFMGRPEEEGEEAGQGKRHVSGESEGRVKSETTPEGDDSMAQ